MRIDFLRSTRRDCVYVLAVVMLLCSVGAVSPDRDVGPDAAKMITKESVTKPDTLANKLVNTLKKKPATLEINGKDKPDDVTAKGDDPMSDEKSAAGEHKDPLSLESTAGKDKDPMSLMRTTGKDKAALSSESTTDQDKAVLNSESTADEDQVNAGTGQANAAVSTKRTARQDKAASSAENMTGQQNATSHTNSTMVSDGAAETSQGQEEGPPHTGHESTTYIPSKHVTFSQKQGMNKIRAMLQLEEKRAQLTRGAWGAGVAPENPDAVIELA